MWRHVSACLYCTAPVHTSGRSIDRVDRPALVSFIQQKLRVTKRKNATINGYVLFGVYHDDNVVCYCLLSLVVGVNDSEF